MDSEAPLDKHYAHDLLPTTYSIPYITRFPSNSLYCLMIQRSQDNAIVGPIDRSSTAIYSVSRVFYAFLAQ